MHASGVVLWYIGQASNVKWNSNFPDKWPRESQTGASGQSLSFTADVLDLVLELWPLVGILLLLDLVVLKLLCWDEFWDGRLPGDLLFCFVSAKKLSHFKVKHAYWSLKLSFNFLWILTSIGFWITCNWTFCSRWSFSSFTRLKFPFPSD